jgi:hypothetical protein
MAAFVWRGSTMSLQALYALCHAHPARGLNFLALFFACAGAWLLLATRQREQALAGSVVGKPRVAGIDLPTQRLNRFFYQFALLCMLAALWLSWRSTQLG